MGVYHAYGFGFWLLVLCVIFFVVWLIISFVLFLNEEKNFLQEKSIKRLCLWKKITVCFIVSFALIEAIQHTFFVFSSGNCGVTEKILMFISATAFIVVNLATLSARVGRKIPSSFARIFVTALCIFGVSTITSVILQIQN